MPLNTVFSQPAGAASPPTSAVVSLAVGGAILLPINLNRLRAVIQVPAGATVYFSGDPGAGPVLTAANGLRITAPAADTKEFIINGTYELWAFGGGPVTVVIFEEFFGTQ